MTNRLYERNSHIKEFDALVINCSKNEKNGFEVILDKSAFFPGGGGQKADEGTINGIPIINIVKRGGDVIHCLSMPIAPGLEVHCEIDWEKRFSRMQNHSGEHVLSGLIKDEFGYDNTGFHMGSECLEIDFSGVLTPKDIAYIERKANEIVTANNPVNILFPDENTLNEMSFRSKVDLSEGEIRIVEIVGADRCACCAPHVQSTGEIGLIKIIGSSPNRQGTRLNVLCGFDALADYTKKNEDMAAISRLFSAKQKDVYTAVVRGLKENEALKKAVGNLNKSVLEMRISMLPENEEGNICLFESEAFDAVCARALTNEAMQRSRGVAAVFCGSEREGYRYCIGSLYRDLKGMAKEINEALGGTGGGSPKMIQGNCKASSTKIKKYFGV